MKRTTILLEEDLLLEVQQLAKEQQITTSQVIQQAVADYVSARSQGHLSPTVAERRRTVPSERTEPALRPAHRGRKRPRAARRGRRAAPVEGAVVGTQAIHWPTVVPLALGALVALLAFIEIAQAVMQLADRARVLGVLLNYVLPGLLLGIVAAALLYIGIQSRQSREP